MYFSEYLSTVANIVHLEYQENLKVFLRGKYRYHYEGYIEQS